MPGERCHAELGSGFSTVVRGPDVPGEGSKKVLARPQISSSRRAALHYQRHSGARQPGRPSWQRAVTAYIICLLIEVPYLNKGVNILNDSIS